jgi:hypothetical protein
MPASSKSANYATMAVVKALATVLQALPTTVALPTNP